MVFGGQIVAIKNSIYSVNRPIAPFFAKNQAVFTVILSFLGEVRWRYYNLFVQNAGKKAKRL